MTSAPWDWARGGAVLVVGASGGVGQALVDALSSRLDGSAVLALSRQSEPALDLLDEGCVAQAAASVHAQLRSQGRDLRLVLDATGFLHGDGHEPEKSWRQIDPVHMARAFAINATGPALLMKHFLPLLPRDGKAVFATLSAKVGSIGDNRLGGWYSYRASKAALNQLVHTAAIELARTRPQAVCVALHPGTVDTRLSSRFARSGLNVQTPEEAAGRLLNVIDKLVPADTGGFLDYQGQTLPW